MTKTIDAHEAFALLEKQVEKKGADYVYPYADCVYFAEDTTYDRENDEVDVEEGTPLCILGNVYADLGLTVDDLRENQAHDGGTYWLTGQSGSIGDGYCDVLPDPDKIVFTDGAVDVLAIAQSVQDQRNSWGDALEAARKELPSEATA